MNLNTNLYGLAVISSFLFVFSACLGSFFKLIVDRYKTNESFIHKPSHCNSCKKELYWWHNIPILGFFILNGKCFFCKSKVDINCLFSEIACSLIGLITFLCIYFKTGSCFIAIVITIFMLVLLLLAMFDLKHRIVPHEITYTTIILIILYQYTTHKYPISGSFANLGIAFLSMDFLYTISTLIKKYSLELSPISIPLTAWSIYFLIFPDLNIYFLLLILILYLICNKFKVNRKLVLALWAALLLMASLIIYKLIAVESNLQTLVKYFSGIGIIYFVAEIIMYFFILFKTKKKVLTDNNEKTTLGGGDITTFALISVFLGFYNAFLSLFIASLLALISHLILKTTSSLYKKQSQEFIPFVPFLSFACFIIIITLHGI